MADLEDMRRDLLDAGADLDEDHARAIATADGDWAAENAAGIARAHPELYRHLILALAAEDETNAVIAGLAIAKSGVIPTSELETFLSWHHDQPWAFVVRNSLSR